MLVCAIGDLTLDVIVRLATPIALRGDTDARIVLGPGGQAANVAAWAATLGVRARFVGRTGDDEAGAMARAGLARRGVEVLGPIGGRNGAICSLVSPDGERSMASDRGVASELAPGDVESAWLAGCDHLYVSGYALFAEPARSAALRAVSLARDEEATVSVDLSSWSGIKNAGAAELRQTVAELAPDVVFANEDEERAFGGPLPGCAWISKRGARGCSFAGDVQPARPVDRVLDTTGAGDALAAGWIVGGTDLALETAAQCVQLLGAMPPLGSPS